VSRDEAAYVADMVEACSRVKEYTAGLDAAALRADRRTVDAVVRNLEVLGEAAKRVSSDLGREGYGATNVAPPTWQSIRMSSVLPPVLW